MRMDLPVETCCCPLCASDVPETTPYGRGPFAVVRCGVCRLWYLSPRLAGHAIRDHYASGDYFEGGESGYASYGGQEAGLRRTFRRLLRQLARHGLTGGSLLEVGCGYGFFLDEAAPYFDARYGTEMSSTAAAQTKGDDLTVYVGGIDAAPADLKVDLIAAFHVIEHIYDPLAFLRGAARHLRPGGAVVLAAPDMGSFWRLLMGGAWPSFKYPEHVAFYDARTLPTLMRKARLTHLERLPYVHDFPLDEILRKLRARPPPCCGRSAWHCRRRPSALPDGPSRPASTAPA
jgi:SAM-dependent methyltransferase